MLRSLKNQKGMSLIEILVVLGIIAVVVGGILNAVIPQGERANKKTAETDIKKLVGYIKQYKQDKGDYPTTDEGLDALVEDGFFSELPNDPWGNPYAYEIPGSHGDKFEVYSEGPDEDDENDNIGSWKKSDKD
jgi:general secretion pathway protein G